MTTNQQTKGDEMTTKLIGLAVVIGIGVVVAINLIGMFSRITTSLSTAVSF